MSVDGCPSSQSMRLWLNNNFDQDDTTLVSETVNAIVFHTSVQRMSLAEGMTRIDVLRHAATDLRVLFLELDQN
jgi:hypothetical protein